MERSQSITLHSFSPNFPISLVIFGFLLTEYNILTSIHDYSNPTS